MIRVCIPVIALLLFALQALATERHNSQDNLVRKRRDWVLPPKPLQENVDYTKMKSIAKIRSDFESELKIQYSLEGIGANQYPFHVFVVDRYSGDVRVTKILDREMIDTYNLSGVATLINGTRVEKNIDLRIKVVDENDNAPVFPEFQPAHVYELSPKDTFVMTVSATDADEPGNNNSIIAYTIINQNPPDGFFYINKTSGSIFVQKPFLDRENHDKYILTIKAQDLEGKPEGNTGTTTVTINVLDVNDNLPTLEKEQYEGSIEENTQGVEVMRIKAKDLDLEGTGNWEAVFDIVKGNEAGYFSIKTDPKTNEGILMLDKPVDYEDVKNLELGLAVRNKNPSGGTFESGASGGSGASGASGASGSSGSVGKFKTYPIIIKVKNQPEGPHFDPKIKAIPISEGDTSFNIKNVIVTYPAIDGDTKKPAKGVKYAKGSDPDNWLTIDQQTAEIKLNKIPDRESPYVVNGTYIAQVLCISDDMPGKTATGTIAIQVEDFNDHCPILTSDIHTMCTTQNTVIVTANDEDAFPNGPPFEFEIIPENTKGKWRVEHLNDTAAILRAEEYVWPGIYEVEFLVKDQQRHACPEPQRVTVHVCTCEGQVLCGKKSNNGQTNKESKFGPAGIMLLLLGLLLLLLIPLLMLFCQYGTSFPDLFTEMPFTTKSHLIKYDTEGQGENTEVPLLNAPRIVGGHLPPVNIGMVKNPVTMAPIGSFDFQPSVTTMNGMTLGTYQNGYSSGYRQEMKGCSDVHSEFETRDSRRNGVYDGIALPHHFLGQYYSQVTKRNDSLCVKDGLLVCDYEGQGSAAGSVGCCSLLESDTDLQFLDDLGPKFKTLAEVCGGQKKPYDEEQAAPLLSSASINTQTSVSSLVSAQKLAPPTIEPTIPNMEQSVVRETTEHSEIVKESTAKVMREAINTVETGLTNQSQMLLIQQQQPVYYTTTPVLQPMHYVVQPQVQNTVLMAEAPTTSLQGMVLVNNTQSGPAEGVFFQGETLMHSGQAQGPRMVLMENTDAQSYSANLIQPRNLSGSQTMMVVKDTVPSGSVKVVKGSQPQIVQGGTLHPQGLSGSKKLLMVGEPTISREQLIQEAGCLSKNSGVSGSERVLYSKSSRATGSKTSKVGSSITTVNTGDKRKIIK